jgi:hypothetical protein
MDSLQRTLLRLIQSDQYGGRIMRTDERTLILYDCGLWTDTHSQYVANRFPSVHITITPSNASLSGFIILFEAGDSTAYRYASLLMAMLLLLFLTARQFLANSEWQRIE